MGSTYILNIDFPF